MECMGVTMLHTSYLLSRSPSGIIRVVRDHRMAILYTLEVAHFYHTFTYITK